jgi:hypothetical protein
MQTRYFIIFTFILCVLAIPLTIYFGNYLDAWLLLGVCFYIIGSTIDSYLSSNKPSSL